MRRFSAVSLIADLLTMPGGKWMQNHCKIQLEELLQALDSGEVIEEYPDHELDLLRFAKYLRYSVWMASVFIMVTIIFGSILMYFR